MKTLSEYLKPIATCMVEVLYMSAGAIVLSMSGILQLSTPVLMTLILGIFIGRIFMSFEMLKRDMVHCLVYFLAICSLFCVCFSVVYFSIILLHSLQSLDVITITVIFYSLIIFDFLRENVKESIFSRCIYSHICYLVAMFMIKYHEIVWTPHWLHVLKLFTYAVGAEICFVFLFECFANYTMHYFYRKNLNAEIAEGINLLHAQFLRLTIVPLLITYILPPAWLLFPYIHFMASIIVLDAIISTICTLLSCSSYSQSYKLLTATMLVGGQLAIYPYLLALAPSANISIIVQCLHTLVLMYRNSLIFEIHYPWTNNISKSETPIMVPAYSFTKNTISCSKSTENEQHFDSVRGGVMTNV